MAVNDAYVKVLYSELTPAEFRQRLAEAPIAYLPLGTLEWHGEHLPLGSDGLQSQGFFMHLARKAGGIVLPMLFVGPDLTEATPERVYYGMDVVGFPKGSPQQLDGSAYWVDETLFQRLLEAILSQLQRAGFKIVVAHGHGPSTNFFQKHSQEWGEKFGLKLFMCWSEEIPEKLGVQNDHAAANETSLVMALHPALVKMDNLPADLQQWPMAIMGEDPRLHASPEVGKEIIRVNVERMERLLKEALETGKSSGR